MVALKSGQNHHSHRGTPFLQYGILRDPHPPSKCPYLQAKYNTSDLMPDRRPQQSIDIRAKSGLKKEFAE